MGRRMAKLGDHRGDILEVTDVDFADGDLLARDGWVDLPTEPVDGFVCEVCGKRYKTAAGFERHMAGHED